MFEYLRTLFKSVVGDEFEVDRENKIVRGIIVAQEGDFKDGRGSFDRLSLEKLVSLSNAAAEGLVSHLNHQELAGQHAVENYLGEQRNFRFDHTGKLVIADLHISDLAMEPRVNGFKPLGEFVMDLYESNPNALSSSFVVRPLRSQRLNDNGDRLPDHWMPVEVRGSDIVRIGNAVHGELLSDHSPECSGITDDSIEVQCLSPQEASEMDPETQKAIDGLQKSTDEKLSELTELISQAVETINEDRSERKQQLSSQQRASEIAALCELSGHVDKGELTKFVNDESLSVSDVGLALFKRSIERNPPSSDDAAGHDSEQLSADAKAAKLEKECRAEFESLGFKSGECDYEAFKTVFAAEREALATA